MGDRCGVPNCSKASTHSVYGVGANKIVPPDALTVCGDHVWAAEREGLAVRLLPGRPRGEATDA